MKILDTTLREGEQTPYVNFTVDEKVEIARLLDQVGVDMIEAGDPSVSPNVAKAIERIASLGLQAEIVAHSIASRSGVNHAKACGADRVAIFYPTSKIHLDAKLHKTPDEAISIICEHIAYARSLDLKVRYTPEDATRTDVDFLVRVCNAAIEAGADRISFADTIGIMQPHAFYERVCELRKSLLPCKIDLHCHDDYGLALANAMAGIRAGADCIHTTVNGMGERTGIPDLAEAKGSARATITLTRQQMHTASAEETACESAIGLWLRIKAYADSFNEGKQKAFDQLLLTLRGMDSDSGEFEQRASLDVGARLPMDVLPDDWYDKLRELAEGAIVEPCGFAVPAWECQKNSPLVRAFLHGIRSQGGEPRFVYKTGTADLNIVASVWKCPALVYGPGDSALDHTPNEHIDLNAYQRAVESVTSALSMLTR